MPTPPPNPPREHLDYLLTAYAFENISPAGRAEVERHLAVCGECRAQLEELRATLALATAALDDGGRDYVFEKHRKARVMAAARASRKQWRVLGVDVVKLSWRLGAVAAVLMVGVLLFLPQFSTTVHKGRLSSDGLRSYQIAMEQEKSRAVEEPYSRYAKEEAPMNGPVPSGGTVPAPSTPAAPKAPEAAPQSELSKEKLTTEMERSVGAGKKLMIKQHVDPAAPSSATPSDAYRELKGIEVPADIVAKAEAGDHFETERKELLKRAESAKAGIALGTMGSDLAGGTQLNYTTPSGDSIAKFSAAPKVEEPRTEGVALDAGGAAPSMRGDVTKTLKDMKKEIAGAPGLEGVSSSWRGDLSTTKDKVIVRQLELFSNGRPDGKKNGSTGNGGLNFDQDEDLKYLDRVVLGAGGASAGTRGDLTKTTQDMNKVEVDRKYLKENVSELSVKLESAKLIGNELNGLADGTISQSQKSIQEQAVPTTDIFALSLGENKYGPNAPLKPLAAPVAVPPAVQGQTYAFDMRVVDGKEQLQKSLGNLNILEETGVEVNGKDLFYDSKNPAAAFQRYLSAADSDTAIPPSKVGLFPSGGGPGNGMARTYDLNGGSIISNGVASTAQRLPQIDESKPLVTLGGDQARIISHAPPAVFETRERQVLVAPANSNSPAVYKTETYQVNVRPASSVQESFPTVGSIIQSKLGSVHDDQGSFPGINVNAADNLSGALSGLQASQSQAQQNTPAVFKDEPYQVVVKPATDDSPAVFETRTKRVMVKPQSRTYEISPDSLADSVTKAGTGVLNLNGLNTYNGGTTVASGTLSLATNVQALNENVTSSGSAASAMTLEGLDRSRLLERGEHAGGAVSMWTKPTAHADDNHDHEFFGATNLNPGDAQGQQPVLLLRPRLDSHFALDQKDSKPRDSGIEAASLDAEIKKLKSESVGKADYPGPEFDSALLARAREGGGAGGGGGRGPVSGKSSGGGMGGGADTSELARKVDPAKRALDQAIALEDAAQPNSAVTRGIKIGGYVDPSFEYRLSGGVPPVNLPPPAEKPQGAPASGGGGAVAFGGEAAARQLGRDQDGDGPVDVTQAAGDFRRQWYSRTLGEPVLIQGLTQNMLSADGRSGQSEALGKSAQTGATDGLLDRVTADNSKAPHSDYLIYPENWKEIAQRSKDAENKTFLESFHGDLDTLQANHPDLKWQTNDLGVTYQSASEIHDAMRDAANGGTDLLMYAGHGNASRLSTGKGVKKFAADSDGLEYGGLDPSVLFGDFGDLTRLGAPTGFIQPRDPASLAKVPPALPAQPPNWDMISRRTDLDLGKRVAEDSWKTELRKKLQHEKKISFEFVDKPLADVVEFLRGKANVNMVIDPKVLADAPPINLRVTDMNLELALEWVLKLADLDYAFQDQAIFISKPQNLQSAAEIRSQSDEKAAPALVAQRESSRAINELALRGFAVFHAENPRLTFPEYLRHPEPVTPVALTDEGMDEDAYIEKYGTRPFVDCERDRLSTFGMDVDTAAYTRARGLLRAGTLPAPDSIRVEEFVNYFKQAYTVDGGEAFGVFAEAADSPFLDATPESAAHTAAPPRQLLKIGIKSRDPRPNERKPATLTFVIDTSGSMNHRANAQSSIDRLTLMKNALKQLVAALNPDDAVSIVGFSEQAQMILPRTQARQRVRIVEAIDSMQPNGATNVEAGLLLGLRVADEAFAADSINRMILISDGMAGLAASETATGGAGANGTGAPSIDDLLKTVRVFAQRGIDLSTIGVGMGKSGDDLLRKFADNGNGVCHFADTLEEARKILLEKLPPHLDVLARDAKVQVEFNPAVVGRYRLLGYEKRKLADKDFRNDKVDAGEVAHSTLVTVLYEILRKPGAHGPLGKVFLRWKDAGYASQPVIERNYPLSEGIEMGSAAKATPEFRFIACVARFAELLRDSKWTRHGSYAEVLAQLQQLPPAFKCKAEWTEVNELVTRARDLSVALWQRNLK